jgi:UDPglucose 6-dehydrogenase
MGYAEVNWGEFDVVMLAVSTPTVNQRVKLDYIEAAALDVGRGLARTDRYLTVIVRSTVPPTTTERRLLPILEQVSGKRVGVDFGICMNPEFLRALSNEKDFLRPWITVVGTSDRYTSEMMDQLYRPFGSLIVHCTPTEAEMIKYVNNVYNAIKISYFNEVYAICEQIGIDSNLVGATVARSAESMWNPLYGIRGGVPYGGACLPKDTAAFMSFAREHGCEHLMLQATMEVNRRLERDVPAVASPDKLEEALQAVRERDEELLITLSQPDLVVL